LVVNIVVHVPAFAAAGSTTLDCLFVQVLPRSSVIAPAGKLSVAPPLIELSYAIARTPILPAAKLPDGNMLNTKSATVLPVVPLFVIANAICYDVLV